jgi:dihydroorotate dehydrogenase electron transfer subunit
MHGRIAFNRVLSASYRWLGIRAPEFGEVFRAGQFLMVHPPLVLDPLLPRAFSVYRLSRADGSPVVEILYKLAGKGTHYLAQMKPEQAVEVLGPLGNGFSLPERPGTAVLVAGGIGVPPIAALALQIRNSKFEIRNNVEVFLGGRTAEDILGLADFETAGARVHITTEDGSLGVRGRITDLLDPLLNAHGDLATGQSGTREAPTLPLTPSPDRRSLTIFTCGPPGMLAAVAGLADTHGVPCQTSVEANMACGFGACMGCAVEVRSSGPGPAYKLVCKDGPVFDSRELVWP